MVVASSKRWESSWLSCLHGVKRQWMRGETGCVRFASGRWNFRLFEDFWVVAIIVARDCLSRNLRDHCAKLGRSHHSMRSPNLSLLWMRDRTPIICTSRYGQLGCCRSASFFLRNSKFHVVSKKVVVSLATFF